MNSAGLAGAWRAADTDIRARQPTGQAGALKRAGGTAWGMLCGTAFLGARASLYVITLAFTALACVAGVVLYGLQAVLGARHG
jgi:hypothetical protein